MSRISQFSNKGRSVLEERTAHRRSRVTPTTLPDNQRMTLEPEVAARRGAIRLGGRTGSGSVERTISLWPERDYILKVVLIGDSAVGKTQLLARYVFDRFMVDSLVAPTIGEDLYMQTHVIENKIVTVRIWDTAGQERYKSVTTRHYRGAVGALLVYDITNRHSFENLPMWLQEVRNGADPNLIIILIGNKTDLENKRQVPTKNAQEFAEREKLLFLETSALDSTNVVRAFITLYIEILHNTQRRNPVPHQQYPASAVTEPSTSSSGVSNGILGPGQIIQSSKGCCSQ